MLSLLPSGRRLRLHPAAPPSCSSRCSSAASGPAARPVTAAPCTGQRPAGRWAF